MWLPHVLSISVSVSPLCINQSLSRLRPLGDSNDLALPSGGWGWEEVYSLFTQGELAEETGGYGLGGCVSSSGDAALMW